MKRVIAVTGLNAGENPQPGPGVIRSLRRQFTDIDIIGLAYGPMESAIYVQNELDVVYQIPCLSVGVDAFMERLDYILARHPIDILIPTLDAEILTLIQTKDLLEQRGIQCLLPTEESFLSRSKEHLKRLVEGTGTYIPKSVLVTSEDGLVAANAELRFPVMVKGPSYDAMKADSTFELSKAFHLIMNKWGGPVILQEFIGGEEFNVAAVGNGKGEIEARCSIRKSVKSEKGKGFGGIVINDPELDVITERIIEKLQWDGPCELEFVQDETSRLFYLIEINPRFPAWIDFPSIFGYNLPGLVVDRLSGLEPEPIAGKCPTGHFFLRHSTDILGRVEDLGQFTACGELDKRNGIQTNKELTETIA